MFLWKAIRHLFTLLLGVFIGAISGYLMNSFLAATGDYLIFEFTIPGALFGLALSTLYVWQTKPLDVYALLKGILIILAGTVSYFAACCTFFYLVGNANLEDAAIGFVAGGVSTTLLLSGLAMITRAYSIKAILVSVICGAILSALLIPLLIPLQPHDNYQGIYIFFIGWQAIMLLVIGIPFDILQGVTSSAFDR